MMECGCRIIFGELQWESKIQYCPMHRAAPDLLDIVNWLVVGIEDEEEPMFLYSDGTEEELALLDDARAALAKAEGK